MIFMILLVPLVLLGMLLGMDRLERWTSGAREEAPAPAAAPTSTPSP
jgi:hypothetical protein